MSDTLRLLGAIARCIGFVLGVMLGVLLALYIATGVAFQGDWHRVNTAVEKALTKAYNDN